MTMKDHSSTRQDIVEAWNRFVNRTYTMEDLALILDSVKNDKHLREFDEVWNRMLLETANNTQPLTAEQEELYREEVSQIIAKAEQRRTIRPAQATGRRFRKLWYAAAAALLLGLLVPETYHYLKRKTAQMTVQFEEAVAQQGEIKTVFLPDSTKVTLNAGSRLKYPVRFTGVERQVELLGEALFDVTSNPAHPFTVKTENMNVKVLGTVFNVKDYADDAVLTVWVVSGKVEVGRTDEKTLLMRNQQFKMDKTTGNFEKLAIDADEYLSWTDGTLYFHQTPIREVVNTLNRYYPQTEIKLAEGDYVYLITGKYNNKQVETVLTSIIYSTGLHCKKTGSHKYTLFN